MTRNVATFGSLVSLGLKLARSGGRGRWSVIAGGSALVAALLLVALAVPQAVRKVGVEIPSSQSIQDLQLSILFALPVIALLFTVLRISSATRDRRLASLRMLGLGPHHTRVVAAVEGTSTAALGALLGLGIFHAVAWAAQRWGWASRWLRQDLSLGFKAQVAVVAVVLLIAVLVALVPTQALNADPRTARSEASTAKLSWWRPLPLLIGSAVLAIQVSGVYVPHLGQYGELPTWWYLVMMGAWALVALAIPLAVPVAAQGISHLLGHQSGWLPGRLAGRRLEVEPASAVRSVTGLALATYSSIIVLTFMAMISQGSGSFVLQESYLNQGPQPIILQVKDQELASAVTAQDIAGLEGMRHVAPRYNAKIQYETGGQLCDTDGASCPAVQVSTCQDYSQFRIIQGCADNEVQMVAGHWWEQYGLPDTEEITLMTDQGSLTLPLSSREVTVDVEGTEKVFLERGDTPTEFLLSPDFPGVAEVLGVPRGFGITADGGRDVHETLTQFGQANGFTVKLPRTSVYENTMLGRAGLMALIAGIIGVGLLSVGIGLIDRTVERRRAVGSLVVIGVPVRTLRISQVVQVLIPLALSVGLSVAAGYLSAQVFVRAQEIEGAWLGTVNMGQDILKVAIPLVAGCVAIALATLPGLGAKLRPELLRKD